MPRGVVFSYISFFQRLLVVQELEKRYEHGLPRLDPVEDMKITEPAISSAVQRIEQLEKQLSTNEVFKVRAWLRPCLGDRKSLRFSAIIMGASRGGSPELGDWPREQKIAAVGVSSMRSQVVNWAPQNRDWPFVHGIPRRLPAYSYIPAKAQALPCEGASAFVRPSLGAAAFSGRVSNVTTVLLTNELAIVSY